MFDDFIPDIDLADGPKFQDSCQHGDKCYLGTISDLAANYAVAFYDVYVFEENGEQKVCLRYGNDVHEYLSPGKLIDFIGLHHTSRHYNKAARLILWKGKFTWAPYQNQPEIPKE